MPYYRLYFFDTLSGHIRDFVDFHSKGDAAALALAHEYEGPEPLELWCGARMVRCFETALAVELAA